MLVFQGAGAKTGVVTGRLLNNSGASLANVRIALSPVADGTELTGITQTDATGRYRIENVPPGEYYVVAGIVESPTYFPGVAARASATRVAVNAGSAVNVPEFRLSGVTLRGRLVQEQPPGGPVMAPVSIRLDRLNSPVSFSLIGPPTIGSFEFSGLTAGEYRMNFIGNLVLPSMQVSIASTDIDDFQVPVPLSALVAAIEGDLRVEGGAPGPPATLTLKDTKGKYNASTIRGETFSVRRIPLGEYTVTVSGLPDAYILKTITAGSANLSGETLTLTPAPTPRLVINVGIDQSAFLRVSGRITNREDYKLPTSIELSGVNLGSSITSDIRPDGSFDFQMLLPGTYTVRLTPDISNNSRKVVVDNQTAPNLEIPLRVPNTRKITGVIAGVPPQPVNGDAITWVPLLQRTGQGNAPPSIRGILGPNGFFEFGNVAPGSYQIVLMRTCAGCDVTIIMMDTAVPVVVEDKDISGVQLFGR